MNNKSSKFIEAILIFVAISYGFLYLTSIMDFSFMKGEIIAYGMACDVKIQYDSCPGKTLFASSPIHFKPNKDRQEVLYWIGNFSPNRLTNCAVVDRKNWKCTYDDKSAAFGFTDGVYFNYPLVDESNVFSQEYYVSRKVWIQQDCNGSINKGPLCIPLHRILDTKY